MGKEEAWRRKGAQFQTEQLERLVRVLEPAAGGQARGAQAVGGVSAPCGLRDVMGQDEEAGRGLR